MSLLSDLLAVRLGTRVEAQYGRMGEAMFGQMEEAELGQARHPTWEEAGALHPTLGDLHPTLGDPQVLSSIDVGGSTIRPGPWGPTPNPNPWSPGGSTLGGSTSMNGVSCMNGVPRSLGQAYYAGPTRMSCSVGYSDICTSLQQCAGLMCSKYIRCPGSISYTRA